MRRVQATNAFKPASVARRMRTGLWVTGQYQEVSVSEMSDTHAQATHAWIMDNAAYYGALLIIHPDYDDTVRNRGVYVRDAANKLANPQTPTAAVAATRLVRDLDERMRQIRLEEDRRIFRRTLPRNQMLIGYEHTEVHGGPGAPTSNVVNVLSREFGMDLEPAPGREKVLELDDGTKIVIGTDKVRIYTTGGNVTTISR